MNFSFKYKTIKFFYILKLKTKKYFIKLFKASKNKKYIILPSRDSNSLKINFRASETQINYNLKLENEHKIIIAILNWSNFVAFGERII